MRLPAITVKRVHYKLSIFMVILISAISINQSAVQAKPSTSKITVPVQEQYVLGVFPHLPPRDLYSVFTPIAFDLGQAIEKKVKLRSSTTFAKFMESMDVQQYDVAFLQPFDYVRLADKYGYRPLATRSQKLSAILVASAYGKIKSVHDLKGKIIALPPEVAAVSYLTKAYLLENDLVPGKDVRLVYYRSHVSCLQQVLIGQAHACGTAAPALRFFEHKMNTKMKIVGKSHSIPHTLFAVHPRVPPAIRKKLRERIITWSKTPEGRKLLSRGRLKPFVTITDKDYDVVRKMRDSNKR